MVHAYPKVTSRFYTHLPEALVFSMSKTWKQLFSFLGYLSILELLQNCLLIIDYEAFFNCWQLANTRWDVVKDKSNFCLLEDAILPCV